MTCARHLAGALERAPSTPAGSSRPDAYAGRRGARFSSLLPALALLLGALSLLTAAQAQDTIWSTTLTVDVVSGFAGCDNTDSSQANCSSALADDGFEFKGTTYNVKIMYVKSGTLTLEFVQALPLEIIRGGILELDSTRLRFDGISGADPEGGAWTNTALTWADGQTVQVSLEVVNKARLSASPNPVTEGSSVTVTATLFKSLPRLVEIPVVVRRGTSEAGDVRAPGTITVLRGSTTGSELILAAPDADTDDETFEVALDEENLPAGIEAGRHHTVPNKVTITIKDVGDTPPPPSPLPPPPPPPPPPLSSDASLSALALSAGALAFVPGTTAYTMAVPYAVASLTLTPTAGDSGATLTVNGVAVSSGEPSAAIALAVGETLIPVVVTAPSGATRTYTVTVTRAPAEVALLPAASSALHGFVRVVNESDEAGTVTVRAFDDAGAEYGPVSLAIAAGAAVQLSSSDLETGNPDKGLTGATGAPRSGRGWRLVFESELSLRALGYVRTREAEGFPAAVHDVVAESQPSAEEYRYEVVFFNPASNTRQASRLRLVNRSASEAAVTITGTDDEGHAGDAAVTLTLPAGAARTLSAPALESGEGLDGALGDGTGKWRLSVASDRPLSVMSLMGSLDGHLTNLSTAPDGVERLWLLPPAANTVRSGFVRIVNERDEAGTVQIRAFDDAGKEYGPLTLVLGAGAARHFNSSDLESGNADKGLTGATGQGQGRWRLAFERDPGVRVLGYVRNHGAPGFPAAVHDVVAESQPEDGYRYEVAFFNPASNASQASVLRLVNRSASEAVVTITGTDDAGDAGEEAVTLTLPAGAARTLSASALESGEGEGLDGALGDGAGKWRLGVSSDQPLAVMSLMRSLDGHLTNLSTAPPASR